MDNMKAEKPGAQGPAGFLDAPRKMPIVGLALTGFLMMTLIYASVYTVAGIYTVPVTETLGGTRAAFNLHLSIFNISCIFGSLLLGHLLRVFGMRRLMTMAALCAGACFFGYSVTRAVWQFYPISALIGFCVVVLGAAGVSILINENVPASSRGTVMGIVMSGSGLGGVVLTPVMSRINETVGWRASYRLTAVLVLLLVPMILAFVRNRQSASGEEDDDAGQGAGAILREKGIPLMLFCAVMLMMIGIVTTGFNSSIHPYARDIGMTETRAAFMVSLASASLMAGKILMGTFCGRFGARTGFAAVGAMLMLSQLLAFSAYQAALLTVPAMVLFGFGNSLPTVVGPLFVGDLYGKERYSKIAGVFFAFVFLGNAIGPYTAGFTFDMSGHYKLFVLICAGLGLLLTAGGLAARRRGR